jgi:hypothetical protein
VQRLVRVFEDFVFGFGSGVDVPMEAAHALVRGLDSPALVDLAGLRREERLEIRDLIPTAAEQLGFDIEPFKAVFERRVREIAGAYLAGEREFIDALSGILALFWRFQDEGVGYYCCDALSDLQLWIDVREFDHNLDSEAVAERDFRARAVAMVEGCRSCKLAWHPQPSRRTGKLKPLCDAGRHGTGLLSVLRGRHGLLPSAGVPAAITSPTARLVEVEAIMASAPSSVDAVIKSRTEMTKIPAIFMIRTSRLWQRAGLKYPVAPEPGNRAQGSNPLWL